jgi:hypothetical protein
MTLYTTNSELPDSPLAMNPTEGLRSIIQNTNGSSARLSVASANVEGAPPSDLPNTGKKHMVKLQEPEGGSGVEQSTSSRAPRERRPFRQTSADSALGNALYRLSSHLEPTKKLASPPSLSKSLYSILTVSCTYIMFLGTSHIKKVV